MKLNISLFLVFYLILSIKSFSQSTIGVGINSTGSAPNSYAGLDVQFQNKGILLPRLSDQERDAMLLNLPEGLIIYNTTRHTLEIFYAQNWWPISLGSPSNCLPASPGAISGATSVMNQAVGVVYSIAAVDKATSYQWTVPTNAVITSGQNTNSITVNFAGNGGNVSVRSQNVCGNSNYTNLLISVANSSGLIASYDFNNSSTTHQVINGFEFEANSDVAQYPLGEVEKGIPFPFIGQGNEVSNETIRERRFSFSPQNAFWFHERIYIPANYVHRKILLLQVSGDLSSWQVGDTILAEDLSTAVIYGITGSEVRVEYAQKDLYSSTWTSNIKNLTNNQMRAATRLGNWSDNNKLAAFWCDGYSFHGQNPSVVFESHSINGKTSSAYVHFSVDNQVTGEPLGEFNDFITNQDLGTWIDVIYSASLATGIGISDGKVELWLKRESEQGYTRKINLTNLPIWSRNGNPTVFLNGYVHGAQNAGYSAATTLFDSMIELYDSQPTFLLK